MNKYKYFFKSDPNKEAIGVVKAKNETQAFLKAAKKKQLPIDNFQELFLIEETE